MPGSRVADVMTRTVITVVVDTPFKDLVATMIGHSLDAVPVIDSYGRLLGVVADVDLLPKLEFHCGAELPPLLGGLRARARWRKAAALTAADVMTTPTIGVRDDAPVEDAVRGLANGQLRRLCVVDAADRLVGVVTHLDLLGVFLRSDVAIEDDIERQVIGSPCSPDTVTVRVADGVVTLDGRLRLRIMVERTVRLTSAVPGIVAVRNHLRFDVDDLMITGF
ncbi:CBS domain-containing protein [Amycolatopsis sp. SID8362]|uniref:CBS domain-containing protein n=1 Tax=Amycolatopsis sp. SID8362 TaxID=2690346 RepID=UPI00136C23D7|nr:CBS domain-containing protein [Amycolatopsis sp. SID8362]NBH03520.1 CBS domain-containing protein [Amycolatopsis sp. SID8362]NBH04625.1 CBS domain-containing protein [Amycolatopsis sp. SID8362]NED40220.1 CBS domain-containing protein [Amycolatopsis sp. SID8362]NED41324.1 CBS domain-containing protein [Amycolatopsis sp. SID8362]